MSRVKKKTIEKTKKKEKTVKWAQRVVNVLILSAVIYLCWYKSDSVKAMEKNKEVEALIVVNSDARSETIAAADLGGEENTEADDYSKLYEANSEFTGWLRIEDTDVSYPVVLTDNNTYYLTHDFFQNKDRHGTIFADYRTDFGEENDNVMLYGHRMRDGSMFGFLTRYEDIEYFNEHPVIEFDTGTEKGYYQILSVFKSKVYYENEDVFKYYQYVNIYSEEDFQEYYENVKELALYETGTSAEYGDHLLTLSTCDYSISDGRLILVAKKIE